MELEDKIKMIDQLIKENPDNTIRDYLDLLKEVETIEKSVYDKRRA